MTADAQLSVKTLLCALAALGLLVLTAPPALAAPPEKPEALKPAPVTATTATLHGILDPGKSGGPFELATYEFVYRLSPTECKGEGEVKTAEGISLGGGKEEVSQGIAGLLANARYTVCLVAHNEAKTEEAASAPVSFTTEAVKPTIAAEATTNVTETSASLTATINPNGAETTYQMQYGTTTAYGSSTPVTAIGSGRAPVAVSASIPGLSAPALFANTTYHWRLTASNAAGPVVGSDHTFVDDTAGVSLPDNRAYELVTPAQKNGALIDEFFLGGTFPQIAANGQRMIAVSVQCFANPESCRVERNTEGEPYAFERTASGWVTRPLAPPASFATHTLWTVSADAATALFGVPHVPAGVIEEDFYGRNEHGAFVNVGPVGEHAGYNRLAPVVPVVSTRDLSHVLYETNEASVWSFNSSPGRALYEYTGTGNATPLMVGVSGGYEKGEDHKLISTCGTELGGVSSISKQNGSLSEDGRTVFFTAHAGENGSGEKILCPAGAIPTRVQTLYARIDGEQSDARSVLISGPASTGCESTECKEHTSKEKAKEEEFARDANFEAASADGSRAFFTDTQQLTDGASEDPNPLSTAANGCSAIVEPGGCNLYESECSNGNRCAQPAERRLIDLSEGPAGTPVPGGPRVQGILGISSDGSHAYFVAKGVLTGAEENQSHEKAEDEKENLYAYERDEAHPGGRLAFIARLAPSDKLEWQQHGAGGVANVTPAGRLFVFTSHKALSADATCVEGEGEVPVCPAQVFEYDAVTRALIRISIGEKGFNDNGNGGARGEELSSGKHAGDATIAEPISGGGSVPLRLDPTMSDDGTFVFFQSGVALTPGALNDVPVGQGSPLNERYAQNVYEYHEGHVSLISDGKDTTHVDTAIAVSPVELLGSDATGSNVFFTTFDPLVPQDTDTQRDIYDAHICSTTEPCPPPRSEPTPCEGEACHGSPPGQGVGQTPGSESFTGPGNLTPPVSKPAVKPKKCRKGFVKKHSKCVKAKAKKKSRARKAGHKRRAK
jgi:hypothetical protein